jgi:hypothetical protein
LLPVLEPFYLVPLQSCKLPVRIPYKRLVYDLLIAHANPEQINRFGISRGAEEASGVADLRSSSATGRIYTVVVQGFFKVRAIFSTRLEKEQNA